jgi:hypothetical protein
MKEKNKSGIRKWNSVEKTKATCVGEKCMDGKKET